MEEQAVPLCPDCGDPVITSGCYPADGVCGGDVFSSDLTSTYEGRWPVDDDDLPPNAGSAS